MNKIIILYPELFKSYSKFHRKIERIVSRLDCFVITCPHDFNGFVEKFLDERDGFDQKLLHEDLSSTDITHAIIFDDGEEFLDEKARVEARGIPLRYISISITRVININKETKYKSTKSTPNYEYIGRGSYWGNPYSMYEGGEEREEVIRKFKYDFDHENFPKKDKKEVYKLMGKRLGCFCKPELCHGDILADYLNSYDDGE